MKPPGRVHSALLQPAAPDTLDTGLRFTDILFGFVIVEIFVRLQNWGELPGFVRWQLVTSTVIVLGSWIGFRRSLNRTGYVVKFFNLPLARFVLDQLMVIFYFRIAILTPAGPSGNLDPASLADGTLETLVIVFGLYFLWDAFGLLMGRSSKYEDNATDWWGISITTFFLACFGILFHAVQETEIGEAQASLFFGIATGLLLAYRFAKDVRSAWRETAGSGTQKGAATPQA